MTTAAPEPHAAPPDDAALLARLRDGEQSAYDVLWSRHIGAALRLGHRLAPGRGEDLASEAFLAVYRQVTTTETGPTSAFRAYLFTVMRNTAMKWERENRHVDILAEIEEIDDVDALALVERQSDASELLDAFRSLPERWQRVLWLAEVEEAGRPAIAADLGIRPNAVSSLQRRARAGLRLQWLTRQIPVHLRDSSDHVASLLPAFVGGDRSSDAAGQIDAHLPSCRACSELLSDLRASSVRFQRTTLSAVGFAALGTVVSVSMPAAPAAALGGVALLLGAFGASTGGMIAVGSIATVVIGALTIGVVSGDAGRGDAAASAPVPSATSATTSRDADEDRMTGGGASADDAAPGDGDAPDRAGRTTTEDGGATGGLIAAESADVPPASGDADPSDPTTAETRTGRHNTDESIARVVFERQANSNTDTHAEVPPTRPKPATDGTVPDPKPDPAPETDPSPGDGSSALTAGLTTPASSTSYLAPLLKGATTPGATVVVEFEGGRYLPAVAPDGVWSYDMREFNLVAPTPYSYRVWAYTDADHPSTATSGSFTLRRVGVIGFGETSDMIPFEEASTTGVVVSVTGAPGGFVCVDEPWSGASGKIRLDSAGRATGRITVEDAAYFNFSFTACAPAGRRSEDDQNDTVWYRGVITDNFVINSEDPTDMSPSPWGPDLTPDSVVFDFPEP